MQTCRFVTFMVIYSMFSYNMSADSSAGAIQGKVFANFMFSLRVLSASACLCDGAFVVGG